MIRASDLYNYFKCPHRVWRDTWGPKDEKDPEPNPFVELLWQRGIEHERKQLLLAGDVQNLSDGTIERRAALTLKAMNDGIPVIYQGILQVDDLLGIPDFLRREPDGSYVPIDIKSGMGFEGVDDENDKQDEGKLKREYALQLALYIDALQRLGFTTAHRGIILDIRSKEVVYDLFTAQGKRTPENYWQLYEETKQSVTELMSGRESNDPAMGSICKLCPWHDSCKSWVEEKDDLSGLFYVGRSKRDVLVNDVGTKTIADLCSLNTDSLLQKKDKNKNFLQGIAEKTLQNMVTRAKIMRESKKPVLYESLVFPSARYELFFDIEDDPTQEFVYMHGVYERTTEGERYLDFTAKDLNSDAEQDAWVRFWEYIRSLPESNYAVYYYSKHEQTTYKKMSEKYPKVVTIEEIETFFDPQRAIDLYYDVVLKKTDWPLKNYSLKAIAQHLGFSWRDETPSGALSIQWFNEYVKRKDPKMLERIRLYNEDDCKATMVLKDALVRMSSERSSS